METYEQYPTGEVYLLSANGTEIGPALLSRAGEMFTVETMGVVKDVTEYGSKISGEGLVLFTDQSEMILRPLKLGDAKTIFPDTLRKFTSIGSLVASVKKEIMSANSYTPTPEAPEETVSITVDGSGNVLELIRVDGEGNLFYRDSGDWTEVAADDEAPTIFDQVVIDIEPDDVPRAVEYYDENVSVKDDITKDEMLEFAALAQ